MQKLMANRVVGIIGAVTGGALGAALGNTIGIAAAGFGMAATVPLALVGGLIGYRAGRFVDSAIDRRSIRRLIRKGPGGL